MSAPSLVDAFLDALDERGERELAHRLARHLTFDSDPLLNVEAKARQLGLHPDTIRRLIREKRLPGATKEGREWRIPTSSRVAGALAVCDDVPARPRRAPAFASTAAAIRTARAS
jgi:excisionase family DNA binding protein